MWVCQSLKSLQALKRNLPSQSERVLPDNISCSESVKRTVEEREGRREKEGQEGRRLSKYKIAIQPWPPRGIAEKYNKA